MNKQVKPTDCKLGMHSLADPTPVNPSNELALHEIDFSRLANVSNDLADAYSIIDKLAASAPPQLAQALESIVPDLSRVAFDLQGLSEKLKNLNQSTERQDIEVTTKREAFPILREEILVVVKPSKIECEAFEQGLSLEEVIAQQKERGEDWQRTYRSHLQQIEARDSLRRYFSTSQIIFGREVDESKLDKYKAVLAFGGDNHLQFVAQKISSDIPVIGVLSDPIFSLGMLLSFTVKQIEALLDDLEKANYKLEAWSRLKVKVGEQELPLALCDVFVGESSRVEMSRQVTSKVNIQTEEEVLAGIEQKSSGTLIATGAGSTGWFKNASRQFVLHSRPFPPDSPLARMLLTEYSLAIKNKEGQIVPVDSTIKRATTSLIKGEKLIIRSLNDDHGVIQVDSLSSLDFPRGIVAEVEISERPLWVIKKAVGLSTAENSASSVTVR